MEEAEAVVEVDRGIAGRWISWELHLKAVEASLPPRVNEACATDDQGMETAKVKGSWLGGRLGGRSSIEDAEQC